MYRITLRPFPGIGDDHTKQAVPLPSRSTTVTEATLSIAGNDRNNRFADQPFPD